MTMTHRFVALTTLLSTAIIAGLCAPSEAKAAEDPQVKVGGRLYTMGFAEMLEKEPHRSQGRIFLFQKNSRLTVDATMGENRFFSQLALGGEDVYTSNTNLTLLDMYATGRFFGVADWRVGQFRVPYGRELMGDDSGTVAFNDSSILSPYFMMGRDVGAALSGDLGPVGYVAGVFTGGGRDTPQRYIPQILGTPLTTLRLSVGDADADRFLLSQSVSSVDRFRQTLSVNGFWMRDSLVGHSNVLSIKNAFEKNLLLSSNYNPYIGKKDSTGEMVQGEFWQAGVDYVARVPVAGGVLSAEAELLRSGFNNQFGGLYATGGRVQGVMNLNPVEVGLRYAMVVPDANMAVTNTNATIAGKLTSADVPGIPAGTTVATTKPNPDFNKQTAIFAGAVPIQELTPSISYHLNKNLKIVVDMPILFNAPIVTENKPVGIGSYNLVNQPDQVTYLNTVGNTIERQFVYQLRGGLQYQF
ncbi:hypothetical protein J7643_09080 [bacterium]|nr:hypothetical protein [bacterium]